MQRHLLKDLCKIYIECSFTQLCEYVNVNHSMFPQVRRFWTRLQDNRRFVIVLVGFIVAVIVIASLIGVIIALRGKNRS